MLRQSDNNPNTCSTIARDYNCNCTVDQIYVFNLLLVIKYKIIEIGKHVGSSSPVLKQLVHLNKTTRGLN